MKRRLWIWMSVLCVLTLVGIVVVKIRVEQRRSVALETRQTNTATIDAMLAETSAAAQIPLPASAQIASEKPETAEDRATTFSTEDIVAVRDLLRRLSDESLACESVRPTPADLTAATEELRTLRNLGRLPAFAEKLDPTAFPIDTVLDTFRSILEAWKDDPTLSPWAETNTKERRYNLSQELDILVSSLAWLRARDGDIDGAVSILVQNCIDTANFWRAVERVVALRPFTPAQRKALLDPLEALYAPNRIKHNLLLEAKRYESEIDPRIAAKIKGACPNELFPLDAAAQFLPEFAPPFHPLYVRFGSVSEKKFDWKQNPGFFFLMVEDTVSQLVHLDRRDNGPPPLFSAGFDKIWSFGDTVRRMMLIEAVALDHCAGARLVFALRDYETAQGTYPDTLDALVPELMAALPVSAWDSASFIYERTERSFSLSLKAYSVLPWKEPIRFRVE